MSVKKFCFGEKGSDKKGETSADETSERTSNPKRRHECEEQRDT